MIEGKVKKNLRNKERGKILAALLAVMFMVSCIPVGTAFAEGIPTTPYITTPIYAGAVRVSGMSEDSASISLTVNSGTAQTTTADSTNGSWAVTVPALNGNDSISVTAQVYGEDVSKPAMATVETVPIQTATPTITTPIYATNTSVSGTSADNASISLAVNSGTVQVAIAYPDGSWTVTGLTLAENDTISVTATASGNKVSQTATATVGAMPTTPVFSDVSASYWGYDAISSLSSRGIVSGYPDGAFKPDTPITRAEFATMLVKALTLNTSGTTGQFMDVTADAWYYGAVNAAASANLVSGMGDNLFAPNALITREQVAVMVANALGTNVPAVDGTAFNAFSDSSHVSSWAVTGMKEAVRAGIVSGMTDGTLAPGDNATRAQAAAMVYKLLTLLGK
jgi:hypothetical protein